MCEFVSQMSTLGGDLVTDGVTGDVRPAAAAAAADPGVDGRAAGRTEAAPRCEERPLTIGHSSHWSLHLHTTR